MFPILINALRETLIMVLSSSLITLVIGLPLGIFVAGLASSNNNLAKGLYYSFVGIMHMAKEVPFLIIMLLFIPFSNWLISHNISYSSATILPLATAGSLIMALSVFRILHNLSTQWQATGKAMGASKLQTLLLITLPEGLGSIIEAYTNTCALIVGFSTISGALGAGGLGQLAIEKSIHDPEPLYVILSLVILVVLQQLFKYTGILVVQQTQLR